MSPNKTVTQASGFVVLIPATKESAGGEATFLIEFGESQPVRAVTLKELWKATKLLSRVDAAHFSAVLALRGALESRDHLALTQAKERIDKVYELKKNVARRNRKRIARSVKRSRLPLE